MSRIITPDEAAELLRAGAATRANQKRQDKFIFRIPLWWWYAMPARAKNVGGLLWFLVGVEAKYKREEDRLTVVLTNWRCDEHGIDRRAKYTSLRLLERAGLITVERRPRRNPIVTLIAVRHRDD
jgi:hypothetical protein